ncbi:hypothetical protein DFA_04732 [Cavenderia fasciculata]|uniref:Uncharacterized protein n=1 Tax=Cavenderia fasciculata TaxID=261658 RepID=F4PQD9_CACFS|nr:uncharacterized protein DFA_04732 [Cavenderia fasciculata]EGG22602.1 hypothetical protein DFA_04732 [Cavenderia fasciculata]|eukprot:XP_004360453.1 hypothetical protein DFA_04732 [Cavenderia fasciculata]
MLFNVLQSLGNTINPSHMNSSYQFTSISTTSSQGISYTADNDAWRRRGGGQGGGPRRDDNMGGYSLKKD